VSVALVTGGGRGVGRTIALALADAGFDVAVASRTQSELDLTSDAIRERGRRAFAWAADVTERDSVEALIPAVESELGSIDLLVNNAGSAKAIGPAWLVDPDLWWEDVVSSLKSSFLCSRAVLPAMIERGDGRIINLSSYVAVRPSPYLSGYAAAKAAVVSFSEGLAAAAAPHGVRVFTITPGLFRTPLSDNLVESEEGRRWLPDVGKGQFVEPERVARLVTFLTSNEADILSGRFLHALDDLDDLLARADEVTADDLYTVRLRR
jgi:NAD(P)-dependent dehydrogenase (short-subunit alcohol dehydrogenase family)